MSYVNTLNNSIVAPEISIAEVTNVIIDSNQIIYKYQFGFRQCHSTQQSIISLVEKITRSLDSRDIVIGIFLDLKKTFDTVDHRIMIKNCMHMELEVAY